MNVFFIPSWYPSKTDPLPGIFFKEQAIALTRHFSDVNIGVSIWGQNDDRYLLWSKQPVRSIFKLFNTHPAQKSSVSLNDNLVEYVTPAYTWTSKILQGNIKNIIAANHENLFEFEKAFGNIDLIHAHVGFPAGYIAKKLAETQNTPYIITEQMSPFPHSYFLDKKGSLKLQLQMAYDDSSANIAISNSLADKMRTSNIRNLKVIPNLTDETFYKPQKHPVKNQIFTFFSLGRMVGQKGMDILLNAFAKIKEDALLKIGGEGEKLKEYQKLAKSLKIDHKVQWLGELNKNKGLLNYQSCDAFVLASRHESMGVVFAEAMACGKPLIGTICGGPEEFISESAGILVPSENIDALAYAMEKMINNHHSYDPEQIRALAEERFSSKVVCYQIRNVYEEVIRSHHQN